MGEGAKVRHLSGLVQNGGWGVINQCVEYKSERSLIMELRPIVYNFAERTAAIHGPKVNCSQPTAEKSTVLALIEKSTSERKLMVSLLFRTFIRAGVHIFLLPLVQSVSTITVQ